MNRLFKKTLAIIVVALVSSVTVACENGGGNPFNPTPTPVVIVPTEMDRKAQLVWDTLTAEEREYALLNMGIEFGVGTSSPTGRYTIRRAGAQRQFWADPRIGVSVEAVVTFWRGVIPVEVTTLTVASTEAKADTVFKYSMEAKKDPSYIGGYACFWADSKTNGATYVSADLFFALGAPECKNADGEKQVFASGVHEAGHGLGFPAHTPAAWGDIMDSGGSGGPSRVEDRMSPQFRHVVAFFWSCPPGTAIWPNGAPSAK